jgi:hypothetical protein
MPERDNFTVFVVSVTFLDSTPLIGPVSVPTSGLVLELESTVAEAPEFLSPGFSGELGISNKTPHSAHSAVSPQNSIGTLKTELHPGHDTLISSTILILSKTFKKHTGNRMKTKTQKTYCSNIPENKLYLLV